MDCLNNLIGIRGGCTEADAPISGLYLNDLTGITVNRAEAAIDEERESGLALLRDKLSQAESEIEATLRTHLSNKMELQSLVDSDIIGFPKEDMPTMASEAYYKGIQIRIDDISHSELHINNIRLQAQSSGDIDIKVFDLITNKLLDTITITTVADEVTELPVNKKYKPFNRRINLLFAYDATSTGSYEATVYAGKAGCCGANKGWYQCRYGSSIYTRAAKVGIGSQKINRNLTSLTYSPGLSINYSLVCSAEPLICTLAQALAVPIRYKAASLVLLEMMHSPRLNALITLNRESHEELLTMYEIKYQESIDSILKNISLPKDACYKCTPAVASRIHIP